MIALVVPIYNPIPTKNEKLSLNQIIKVWKKTIIFIGPKSLNHYPYRKYVRDNYFKEFDCKYFKSTKTYNKLLLEASFYKNFIKYKWILICQTDAYLLSKNIKMFTSMNYDYYGAPWPEGQFLLPFFKNPYLLRLFGKKAYVGNGGFSLRKVNKCIELLSKKKIESFFWRLNEDGFFAYYGLQKKIFKTCPLNIAKKFAAENLRYNLRSKEKMIAIHKFKT